MSAAAAQPADRGLLRWTLTFLRPYRARVSVLSVLLVSEIVLGALQPWPFAIVIDYVLSQKPFPDHIEIFGLSVNTPLATWLTYAASHSRMALLSWEKRVHRAKPHLSAMESKKIQLAARRLWKRISD
jgi:hypothetical protein